MSPHLLFFGQKMFRAQVIIIIIIIIMLIRIDQQINYNTDSIINVQTYIFPFNRLVLPINFLKFLGTNHVLVYLLICDHDTTV